MVEKDEVHSSAFRLRWDVFLSFRGEDTRDNFIDSLFTALHGNGVRVFRGNDGLTQGDSLAPTLLEAIEDSAAAIAVISPKYASSRWCLEELATICECQQLVLPVFYRVDPSDVRRQKGPFEEDFRRLEERFGVGKVRKWREAMEKVGGVSGWVFHMKSKETPLIQALVKRVMETLSNTPLAVPPCMVGVDSCIQQLMSLLDVKCNGIKVLGLHGMGGVGKTTLSKALYNKLVARFEHRCFISNVRETCEKQNGLVALQMKLIDELSQGKRSSVTIEDVKTGKRAIRELLHENQVLIVLDDIDNVNQIDALTGKREWFYEGSRIIISTRDREVLQDHLVTEVYEVRELGSDDALELFSYHALRRKRPSGTFLRLSEQIVSLTGGLPLALEVIGSSLFHKRNAKEWEDALQKLRQIRPHDLQEVLKISFDGLGVEEKCVFLDIACLFQNPKVKREDAVDIITGCGFRGETVINVLVARSLIKVTGDEPLWMHDQIRDMGRQIVLHENIGDPGMRSRLWDQGEVLRVLRNWTGTRFIQGIVLDLEKSNKSQKVGMDKRVAWNNLRLRPSFTSVLMYLKELYKEFFQQSQERGGEILWTKQLKPMVNLRLLKLNNITLEGNFETLPAELKCMQCQRGSLRHIPCGFFPSELTVLDLSESKMESIWGQRRWHWRKRKCAEKLMVLNLRGCCNLTASPDISTNPSLEKLVLEGCRSLTKIHKSVGDANALKVLNLRDCVNLVEFPSDISGLKHLEKLILSGCSKLKDLPVDMVAMHCLKELLVDETSIEKLPDSIFQLTKLENLSMNNCQSLKRLPACIGKLSSLRTLSANGTGLEEIPGEIHSLGNLEILSLMHCKSLVAIPDSVCNLMLLSKIWLDGSSVKEIPDSIGYLYYLKLLSVGSCLNIRTLPDSIQGLSSMVELCLDKTSIVDLPDHVGELRSLKKLEMRGCRSLRSLSESIGNLLALERLVIVNASIRELPEDLGRLENLTLLRLNNCEQLSRLPASFGNLKSLHVLQMKETSVIILPENFGMLSNLMFLSMSKKPSHQVPQIDEIPNVMLPSSFSNLSSLIKFDARSWRLSGKMPDDFGKLTTLEELDLGHNDFFSLPCSLIGLSCLKKLLLPHCRFLEALPPLPASLVELNAANCTALETISDLSNLGSLQYLYLTNCQNIVDIPGLECLKSLRRLHIGGCTACTSIVKSKVDKGAMRRLYSLSMPGSQIPDWFTQRMVVYSKRRNQVIKGIIIVVVVSVDPQTPDDFRDNLPVIPNVQAKIIRSGEQKFCTALPLQGVPNTREDQVYLCRYRDNDPLLLFLEDGDQIVVAAWNLPYFKSAELKKCGIHLVFENDDDYDGDEASLDESQQSVSQKLTEFIGFSGENDRTSELNSCEGLKQRKQMKMEEKKQRTARAAYDHTKFSPLMFTVLASFFLLCGLVLAFWLVP